MQCRCFQPDGRVFLSLLLAILLLTLHLGLLVAPHTAEAPRPAHVPRIGILSIFSPPSDTERQQSPLLQGLRDLGYIEGQHITFEERYADGQRERLPALAAELVQRQVDLIVAGGGPAVRAAKETISTIPIVMATGGADPVRGALVASLARPGGNIMGLVQQRLELTAKQLELLKEALPTVTRIAVLWDEASADQRRAAEAAARPLGVQLQPLELRHPPYEFAAAAQGQAEALLVLNSPIFFMQCAQIADLMAKSRLPTMFGAADGVRAGGLMAYDVNTVDIWRRIADYVEKILKGAKPADLPVEQPIKFALVLNLKTAKALGITFPPTLLIQADEVIQ